MVFEPGAMDFSGLIYEEQVNPMNILILFTESVDNDAPCLNHQHGWLDSSLDLDDMCCGLDPCKVQFIFCRGQYAWFL